MESVFFEISIVLIVGTLFATIAKLFRQPMIPAYILAGVLVGPPVLGIIHSGELLETLSTFGIAFLLFLVGIELDLRTFLKTSRVAVLLGIVQMLIATGVGYLVISALGFTSSAALFLAVALGFSSTIVVLKLIGERRELDTLYGQIVIGIMLTQDFIAVLILIFLGVFTGANTDSSILAHVLLAVVKGVLLFGTALVAAKYILTPIFKYFARSNELLFLGAICWCLIFSMFSLRLGFSIEVGSLLAGVSLSLLPYSIEISNRITSLRDFFLPIFFATLGGELVFNSGESILIPTIVLSALVLVVSSVVVTGMMLWLGYRSRTSFQTGFALGQVSEFSFVLVALGHVSGFIEQHIVALVALIGLVTMTVSSYCIDYSDQLYKFFRPFLKRFERKDTARKLEYLPKQLKKHVVLFGHHAMGYKIRLMVDALKKPLVVIDNNPDVIEQLAGTSVPHLYGSMNDVEIFEKAELAKAEYIISTVPVRRETVALLQYARRHRLRSTIIVTAHRLDDALDYYALGASFVIFTKSIGAEYLEDLLQDNIAKRRKRHLKELHELKGVYETISA